MCFILEVTSENCYVPEITKIAKIANLTLANTLWFINFLCWILDIIIQAEAYKQPLVLNVKSSMLNNELSAARCQCRVLAFNYKRKTEK